MFDIQHYPSFLAAILVFQAVPGAGTIAIVHATARDGRRAGFAAVAGTLTGDCLFMAAAVAGLAALLQAHPTWLVALQTLGAAYLCWLGLQLLTATTHASEDRARHTYLVRVYFHRALAVSLTNPKVILFFVAFFPLFLAPGASAVTLAIMMLHVVVISLLYQALLVVVGNSVAKRFKSLPWARRTATCGAGLALIGLGLKLLADSR